MDRDAKTASVAPARQASGLLTATLFAAGVLLLHTDAAMAATRAVVRAFAYHPVPADGVVAVVPWDDNAENLQVKAAFEAALRERGRAVAPEAGLELRFELEVRQIGPGPDEPSLGSAGTAAEEGLYARFNVWSSAEDSLLGGLRSRDGRRVTLMQVTATLRQTAGERLILWRGEARTALGDLGRAEAGGLLARPIVARLGETLVGTTVTLAP